MKNGGPGWAQALVATWAGNRAKETLRHAERVRVSYNNEPLHGLCARYADVLARHTDELCVLEQELLREAMQEKPQ